MFYSQEDEIVQKRNLPWWFYVSNFCTVPNLVYKNCLKNKQTGHLHSKHSQDEEHGEAGEDLSKGVLGGRSCG